MTTRRDALRLASVVPAAALLAACTDGGSPGSRGQRPTGPADLLTVRTSTGLCVIDARSGVTVLDPQPGVLAIDGSAIASAAGAGAVTEVRVRPQDHREGYEVAVVGAVGARAVSTGGYLVALATGQAAGNGVGAATYRPAGRSETTIVVVGSEGERHRLTLPGCVEPEAFSITGDRLFVLDYLPPQAPDRYRVRQVDLLSGGYTPLYTRSKELIPQGAEEEMRGEGRQAVYASTRHMLFTLYTHQPDHEHTRDLLGGGARPGQPHVHAFVHSLHVDGGFAYCIDLPAPFGEGPASAHAIALSARAREHPFVADTTSGTVARLDGEQLTVADVGKFGPGQTGGEASAVVTPDGARLLVGTGTEVVVIRTDSLATAARWSMPGPINGLGVSLDGARIWVGQPDRVVALDAHVGRVIATVPVVGVTGIADVHVAR